MSDLSARALLECFHRYLDSESRFVDRVAPDVYEFCGAQARAGSSTIDVACGRYRHAGATNDFEILAGRLLSIDAGDIDVRDGADRRFVELADGSVVTLPAPPTGDRRFELCGAQPEP